jgi:hypothetical protein
VYQDFFMGSRLAEYRSLLSHIKQLGYDFRTMAEFVEAAGRGGGSGRPTCLLRNDVDSDPGGAARMFACDREAAVRATYYFRLATIDPPLMQEIVRHGGEVGYHFEEIATVAKRLGLRSRKQIDAGLDLMRREFRDNVFSFRARSGVMPRTVASHGDFANRRIGVPNHHLLTRTLMDDLGIVADAYDPRIHAELDARYSDCPPPEWWRPQNPLLGFSRPPRTVSILVHPRQWTCAPALNFRLAAERLWEEGTWRWNDIMASRRQRELQSAADT